MLTVAGLKKENERESKHSHFECDSAVFSCFVLFLVLNEFCFGWLSCCRSGTSYFCASVNRNCSCKSDTVYTIHEIWGTILPAWKLQRETERQTDRQRQRVCVHPHRSSLVTKLLWTHHADRDIFRCRAEGDSVEVDESLFEDMEDLDLDEADDDEDDPDYVPWVTLLKKKELSFAAIPC